MHSLREVKPKLLDLLNQVGKGIGENQLTIIDRGRPHLLSFNEKKLYVYTFNYNNVYLKIGKAGNKSKARVIGHHYNPASSQSNLAKSILSDESMKIYNLNENSVGNWIKNNVDRVDIELNAEVGVFVMNFIEAALHCMYLPKYEGFETQR
ncbi:hypothetical protein GC093_16905 [Paenibacillus sp. LMG 31456]|uniref:Uncharacterized protein n=1 Tax=Paenibacillus foliorum TaxID=2654974 RepID=A0A972GR62_9BACL|nr:hypothetical protein [Paenibacillus foliorum]NOU94888.1 hypothetical protein [Paenibacillus foliorum]